MTTICRHIKTNGERCGCPAMRAQPYCYFHRNLTANHPKPAPEPTTILHPRDGREPQVAAQPDEYEAVTTGPDDLAQSTLNLPALEDRESIQLAASMIIGALARNTLDIRRAATLLYGLQVASANARNLQHRPSPGYAITETTLTPAGDEIAPDVDPEGEIDFQQFLHDLAHEELANEDDEDGDDDDPGPGDPPSPARRYLARQLLHG